MSLLLLDSVIVAAWLVLSSSVQTTQPARAASSDTDTSQITFTSRVIDAQGEPISGVRAALYRETYGGGASRIELLAEKAGGADGMITFTAAKSERVHAEGYVLVRKEGLHLGWAVWQMEGDQRVDITLSQGKDLGGDVVDEKKQPIPDAEVSIAVARIGAIEDNRYLISWGVFTPLLVKTDSRGHFVFRNMPVEATFEFLVNKAGRATVRTFDAADPGGKGQFSAGQSGIEIVMPPEATIRGVLVEQASGKPVGGMRVLAQPVSRGTPSVNAWSGSGDDGVFHLRGLGPGDYSVQLVVTSPPMPEWVAEPVQVSLKAGETRSDVKVELAKGAIIEVLVKDREGNPVAQAEVGLRRIEERFTPMQRTDEKGLLRMRVTPGEYAFFGVYETESGLKTSRREGQFAVAEGETKRIEYVQGSSLKIPGAAGIAGIVRDEAGNPLADVDIQVLPMRMLRDAITSDASGHFEIPQDPAIRTPRNVTLILVARHLAYNLAASTTIEEQGRALDLKLQPGLTVTGTVLSDEGQPLAGGRVRVILNTSRWSGPLNIREPIATGRDGRFEIKALPVDRQYTIAAAADGYGRQNGQVDPEDSQDHRCDVGRLKLPLANLSVTGVVVDPNDRPVAGALISGSGEGQPDRLHAQTDAEGKFTLQGTCLGPIRLIVSSRTPTPMHATAQAEGGATDLRIVVYPPPATRASLPRKPAALKGKPLPSLKDLEVDLPADVAGKMLLVCFWDMDQRPSRSCLAQLAVRAAQLREKGVEIVVVHATKVESNAVNQWMEENNIPFKSGTITGDVEKTRFDWGVNALPHLVLTDRKHTVVEESFEPDELDKHIETAAGR